MKILKIAQTGEWWIVDGEAVYADGETGEMNHERYVVEIVRNEIAETMGFWSNNDMFDWGEMQVEIVRKLILYNKLDEDLIQLFISEHGEDWLDQLLYEPEIFDTIALAEGVDKIKLDVATGAIDARKYGMKELGWKRVAGKAIQTWTLTANDLRIILKGLESAFGDECEDKIEDMVFDIEVLSTHKVFWNIPFSVIEKGNPASVARYGGRSSSVPYV